MSSTDTTPKGCSGFLGLNMTNLLTLPPQVKPCPQPQFLPSDFPERYQQWLTNKGLSEQEAHWWLIWVQRFRAFRRREESPKSFTEATVAFLDYQRHEFDPKPWQIDQARKAILERTAWWHAFRTGGGFTPADVPVYRRCWTVRNWPASSVSWPNPTSSWRSCSMDRVCA